MAKHYAKEEGLLATMMPRPFANRTGTGAHFNISLYDLKTGANLFACAPEEERRATAICSRRKRCPQSDEGKAGP
jgi:glutamine synthetase